MYKALVCCRAGMGSSITMDDLAGELKDKVPYALGIRNIVDKAEMKAKLEEFLATKQ